MGARVVLRVTCDAPACERVTTAQGPEIRSQLEVNEVFDIETFMEPGWRKATVKRQYVCSEECEKILLAHEALLRKDAPAAPVGSSGAIAGGYNTVVGGAGGIGGGYNVAQGGYSTVSVWGGRIK